MNARAYEIPVPRLAVEPGRALVGPSDVHRSTKWARSSRSSSTLASRTYVSVDGGMSDNPRTSLYEADYTVSFGPVDQKAPPMLARIVGKHCESGDIVVRDAWLPRTSAPATCSLLRPPVPTAGAWRPTTTCMGRPPVVAVSPRRDGSTCCFAAKPKRICWPSTPVPYPAVRPWIDVMSEAIMSTPPRVSVVLDCRDSDAWCPSGRQLWHIRLSIPPTATESLYRLRISHPDPC